jgi:hypothetical protein
MPVGNQRQLQHAVGLAGQMRRRRGSATRGRRWRPGGFGFYQEFVDEYGHQTARSSFLKNRSQKLLLVWAELFPLTHPTRNSDLFFTFFTQNVYAS